MSGAWHPLTPSWVPFRSVPAPQILEDVEVIQHVPIAVEQIVCIPVPQIMPERGGGTACAVYIPQVQFLDKVVAARCCTMTGAWGLTEQKTVKVPQLQCSDKGDDVPVVQVVVGVSWKVPQIHFIA